MYKLLAVVVASLMPALASVSPAFAQQDPDQAVPVEFFACDWRDGKGMADLERVTKKFNAWADKNDEGYSAWILTPQFHDGLDFDIGWMGSWADSVSFGKAQDRWMADGRQLAADFDSVVDCSKRHQLATSVAVNAPDGPPDDGVVMFLQCTMREGKSPAEALPAHRKSGAAMREMGSKGMSWLFYPFLGTSQADFDYWSVLAFNNYTELGATQEKYLNGGGWEKVMGILGPVSDCKDPSVFDAKLVRAGARR